MNRKFRMGFPKTKFLKTVENNRAVSLKTSQQN